MSKFKSNDSSIQDGSHRNTTVSDSQMRTLSVQGQGESTCSPDNFQMTVSLSSSKPSTQEAEASVKKRSDYVLQVLRNHGLSSNCINMKTCVSRHMEKEDVYVFSMIISVIGKDYDRLNESKCVLREKLSDSVTCSDIHCSVSFKHRINHREEAFKDAIMNAKSKGTLVSKCLGVELGPVVTLTEDSLNERPLPRDQTTAKKHDPDRISESTVVITCNVSAVFELHTVENNKKKS